jgi:hypothetical protein
LSIARNSILVHTCILQPLILFVMKK